MSKIKNFILFLWLSMIFFSCLPSKKNHTFSIASYILVDTTKQLLSKSNFISYDDYIFEFILTKKFNLILHGESNEKDEVSNFDTTGVYLLSKNDKLYFQFDTFSIKNRVVQTGKRIDKTFGVKFGNRTNEENKNYSDSFLFGKPVSFKVNDIECFYLDILPKYDTGKDLEQRFILMKIKSFNSIYKVNGIRYTDTNYCIIGYRVFDNKLKQGYSEEIETLRQISDYEKNICESIIAKSKSCVTDTIKGILNSDKIGY